MEGSGGAGELGRDSGDGGDGAADRPEPLERQIERWNADRAAWRRDHIEEYLAGLDEIYRQMPPREPEPLTPGEHHRLDRLNELSEAEQEALDMPELQRFITEADAIYDASPKRPGEGSAAAEVPPEQAGRSYTEADREGLGDSEPAGTSHAPERPDVAADTLKATDEDSIHRQAVEAICDRLEITDLKKRDAVDEVYRVTWDNTAPFCGQGDE